MWLNSIIHLSQHFKMVSSAQNWITANNWRINFKINLIASSTLRMWEKVTPFCVRYKIALFSLFCFSAIQHNGFALTSTTFCILVLSDLHSQYREYLTDDISLSFVLKIKFAYMLSVISLSSAIKPPLSQSIWEQVE